MESGTSNRSLNSIIAMAPPFDSGSQIPFGEASAATLMAASATPCSPPFAVIIGESTMSENVTVATFETVCDVVVTDDASPTTVPVTLTSVVPSDTAVSVRRSLDALAPQDLGVGKHDVAENNARGRLRPVEQLRRHEGERLTGIPQPIVAGTLRPCVHDRVVDVLYRLRVDLLERTVNDCDGRQSHLFGLTPIHRLTRHGSFQHDHFFAYVFVRLCLQGGLARRDTIACRKRTRCTR